MDEKNKTEGKTRECVVLGYGGKDYWDGTACYSSDFNDAKIFKEAEVPEWVKGHYDHKIIFLDTREGLELLTREFEKLQDYVEIYEARVNGAKKALNKLLKFESVQKYIDLHNRRYHPIIGISQEAKDRILKEIVEKEK